MRNLPRRYRLLEQAALLAFVQSGKGAVILTDNDSAAGQPQSDIVNEVTSIHLAWIQRARSPRRT